MPVSGLNHGHLASRNPPLQDLAFRPVQVIAKAFEVAIQELLTKSYKAQFPDNALLHFQHVRAFLKFTPTCATVDLMDIHQYRKRK